MSFEDLDGFDNFLDKAKADASAWAKELLSNPTGFVILDTETTGLDNRAEICQVAVLRGDGLVLLDTLARPRFPIPEEAIRIHGITNEMVAAALPFLGVFNRLLDILAGHKRCVIYNADYDLRLIGQSLRGTTLSLSVLPASHAFECAMLQYSRWYGDWNDYRADFRWQKLQGGDHSALGDCRATLQVIKRMAGVV